MESKPINIHCFFKSRPGSSQVPDSCPGFPPGWTPLLMWESFFIIATESNKGTVFWVIKISMLLPAVLRTEFQANWLIWMPVSGNTGLPCLTWFKKPLRSGMGKHTSRSRIEICRGLVTVEFNGGRQTLFLSPLPEVLFVQLVSPNQCERTAAESLSSQDKAFPLSGLDAPGCFGGGRRGTWLMIPLSVCKVLGFFFLPF